METRLRLHIAIQARRIENHVNARILVAIHRLDHVGADHVDEFARFFGIVFKQIEPDSALLDRRLRLSIDGLRQFGDIRPLLGHLNFQIVCPIDDLFAENGAFVAVHLAENAAQVQRDQKNRRLQKDQHHQRLHGCVKNGPARFLPTRFHVVPPFDAQRIIARQSRSIRSSAACTMRQSVPRSQIRPSLLPASCLPARLP